MINKPSTYEIGTKTHTQNHIDIIQRNRRIMEYLQLLLEFLQTLG